MKNACSDKIRKVSGGESTDKERDIYCPVHGSDQEKTNEDGKGGCFEK